MPIEFTEWASDILQRTYEAARRLNPAARVRMARSGAGVAFTLTDEPEASDTVVQGEGFELLVQEGLEGIVDVVEPHDQLVLRPPGSTERSVREPH
jgi:Fe-S cluster assembly iron-binding protein IscA